MKQQLNFNQGFGLLEVVLASGILALVIGAAVGLVRNSLSRTTNSLDRTVAMNLAQESIEELRAARDTTYIDQQPNSWDEFLKADNGCDIQLPTKPTASCSYVITQPSISSPSWIVTTRQQPESIQSSGQKFTREIYITNVSDNYANNVHISNNGVVLTPLEIKELIRKVHVIVRWNDGSQAVDSETYLTAWRSGV
jgi:Tfp pilus assembly protein PilV